MAKKSTKLTIDLHRLITQGPKMVPGIIQAAAEQGLAVPGWLGQVSAFLPFLGAFVSVGDDDIDESTVGPAGVALARYLREKGRYPDEMVRDAVQDVVAAGEAGIIPRSLTDLLQQSVAAGLTVAGASEEDPTAYRRVVDSLLSDVAATPALRRSGDAVAWTLAQWSRGSGAGKGGKGGGQGGAGEG